MRQNRSSNNHTRPWTTKTHGFLGIFSSHKKRLASPCQSCRNAPASSEESSHLKRSKAISGKQISQTWSRMQVMIEMNLIYFVLLDSAWSISSWYQHSIALMNSGLCSGQPSCAEPAGGGGGFSSASGRRLKSGDVRITGEKMMICDLSWPAYWVYWPPNRSLVLSLPFLSLIRYLKMSLKGIKCSPLSLQDICTTLLLLSLRLQLYLLTLPASSLPKPSPINVQQATWCKMHWIVKYVRHCRLFVLTKGQQQQCACMFSFGPRYLSIAESQTKHDKHRTCWYPDSAHVL